MQRVKLERGLLLRVPYCRRSCSTLRWFGPPFPPTRYSDAAPAVPGSGRPTAPLSFQQPYNVPPPPAFSGAQMPQQPSSDLRLSPWPPQPVRFTAGEVSEAFTALIDSFHKKGLVQEVDRVIQGMNAAQIMLSLPSYRTLIDIYAGQGDLERMDAVYCEMRKAAVRMSTHEQGDSMLHGASAVQKHQATSIFAALMDHCHKRALYDQVQHIHRAMKAAQLIIPFPMYNILMETYSQLGDCDKMDAAYYEMRQILASKRGPPSSSSSSSSRSSPPSPPPLHPWVKDDLQPSSKLPPLAPPYEALQLRQPPPPFTAPPPPFQPPPPGPPYHFQPPPPPGPPYHFQPPPPPPFHFTPPPPAVHHLPPPVPVAEQAAGEEESVEEDSTEADALNADNQREEEHEDAAEEQEESCSEEQEEEDQGSEEVTCQAELLAEKEIKPVLMESSG